nr:hypothetical protein BDOA9_0160930 [Bradyrhizobium sp. DOA9]
MPAIRVSSSASAVVVIATSLEPLGKRGDHRPADRAGGIEPAQRGEQLLGLFLLVLAQMDEGERLQRVEREAAGAVRQFGLWLPASPVGTPAGLVGSLAQTTLGDALGLFETTAIGVGLVEAEIDRELRRRGLQGLPEDAIGFKRVAPIADHALLQQRVDFGRELAEIDAVGIDENGGHGRLSFIGPRRRLESVWDNSSSSSGVSEYGFNPRKAKAGPIEKCRDGAAIRGDASHHRNLRSETIRIRHVIDTDARGVVASRTSRRCRARKSL